MAQVVEDGAEVLGIPVYEKGTALVLKSNVLQHKNSWE